MQELALKEGLFIQSGYDSYEFPHKSLQEYLTAEFLIKLPQIPNNPDFLNLMANELAIATAISTSPSLYFADLILKGFQNIDN